MRTVSCYMNCMQNWDKCLRCARQTVSWVCHTVLSPSSGFIDPGVKNNTPPSPSLAQLGRNASASSTLHTSHCLPHSLYSARIQSKASYRGSIVLNSRVLILSLNTLLNSDRDLAIKDLFWRIVKSLTMANNLITWDQLASLLPLVAWILDWEINNQTFWIWG